MNALRDTNKNIALSFQQRNRSGLIYENYSTICVKIADASGLEGIPETLFVVVEASNIFTSTCNLFKPFLPEIIEFHSKCYPFNQRTKSRMLVNPPIHLMTLMPQQMSHDVRIKCFQKFSFVQ